MLYIQSFQDYESFKILFAVQHHTNGTKSRRNRILLSMLKSKAIHQYALRTGDLSLLSITDMVTLKNTLMQMIQEEGGADLSLKYQVKLINYTLYSSKYESDEMNSLCEDGDAVCCRYINHETDCIRKMKAGRYFRHLILETSIGRMLPEQISTWLQEQFVLDWQVYTRGNLPSNHLHVDKNFKKIYDSFECVGDFKSCMVNRDLHSMYEDSCDCNAAYLTNDDGKIIARCIIFNNVIDEDTGEIHRIAARQYSTDQNDVLKRALVDALIKEKVITAYSTVGCDCHSSRAIVDINGNSLQDKKFKIKFTAETDDPISYMDMFKFYNYRKSEAYNHEENSYDYCLDTTEGSIDGENEDDEDDENYDSYHDSYTYSDVVYVQVDGVEMTCSENRLEDFTYMDNYGWVHNDDISVCPICGTKFITNKGAYSDTTDETYCGATCLAKGEEQYHENHPATEELAIAG